MNTRTLTSLLICSLAALTTTACTRGQLQWRKSTPLPEPRAGYAAGILDGKLIIAGGTDWDGEPGAWTMKRFVATTHAFDPATEDWQKLPDAPYPFSYAAYAVSKNRLYVLGGYDGERERTEILKLEKEDGAYHWEFVGELPEKSLFAWAGAVGSSIYLLGGVEKFEPYDAIGTCCTSRTATKRLMVWDADRPEGEWRQLPSYPGPKRWIFTADTDGESIWMFGGRYQEDADGPTTTFNDAARYRIDEGVWEPLPALPEETVKARPLVALHVDGTVLLMSYDKTVWEFDVEAQAYTTSTQLPHKVFVDRFFWFDDQILGAGGENGGVGPRRRSEWTFVGVFKDLE